MIGLAGLQSVLEPAVYWCWLIARLISWLIAEPSRHQAYRGAVRASESIRDEIRHRCLHKPATASLVVPTGRFAPSPTGRLHLGNLRTALLAWLYAREHNSTFLLRFEDLDTAAVREEHYHSQREDLAELGLDWDPPVVQQSDRLDLYRQALADLEAKDLVYPCFCSRREIREAAERTESAPRGPPLPQYLR